MPRYLAWIPVTALVLVLPGAASADMIYLALGDSSAFGETNRTQNPSSGDRGYVAPFADYLATRYGVRPGVVNLAIDGETTKSFETGKEKDRVSTDNAVSYNKNYAPYAPPAAGEDYLISQQRLAQQTIAANLAAGNTIPVVTVQLGANDLFAIANDANFLKAGEDGQKEILVKELLGSGGFGARYGAILADVRAQLPGAEVYAIGYHNPYPGAPRASLSSLFAKPSVGGVQFLNSVIAGVGEQLGAKYVDFYTPVVGREAELTHIALKPNGKYDYTNDVHLNATGYALEARQLIAAAGGPPASPVPAPPSALLAVIAAVGLGASRLSGRRKGRAGAASLAA